VQLRPTSVSRRRCLDLSQAAFYLGGKCFRRTDCERRPTHSSPFTPCPRNLQRAWHRVREPVRSV